MFFLSLNFIKISNQRANLNQNSVKVMYQTKNKQCYFMVCFFIKNIKIKNKISLLINKGIIYKQKIH